MAARLLWLARPLLTPLVLLGFAPVPKRWVGMLGLILMLLAAAPAVSPAPARAEAMPFPLCELPDIGDSQREAAIRRVYERLIRAVGDRRIQPVLSVSYGQPSTPAVIEPETGIVRVESHLYDVCNRTGRVEDCLAFVLGHELVHFTQQHRSGALAGAAASPHLRVEQEARADYHGVFYAHLAGYDARSAVKPALEAVYACYGLDDRIPGYLPREQRLGVLDDAVQQAREWLALFDLANHLVIVRRYDLAYPLFDHIGREFPSREILNNAAAARLMTAQTYARSDQRAYPIQLDLDTRLSERATTERAERGPVSRGAYRAKGAWSDARVESDEERRRRLLEEAIRELNDLHHREGPVYAPGTLNLASGHVMVEETREAARLLEELGGAGGPIASDVAVLQALILADAGETEDALVALAAIDDDAARWNEHLLRHGRTPPGEAPSGPPDFTSFIRAMENRFPGLVRRAAAETEVRASIVGLDGPAEVVDVRVDHRRDDDYKLMVLNTGSQPRAVFLGTGSRAGATTHDGLQIGDSRNRVAQLHGSDHRSLPLASGGEYLVYDRQALLVAIEEGVVAGWMYYWSER